MEKLTNKKEYIYYPDGSRKEIFPKNGSYYELEELQDLVGGYIQLLYSHYDKNAAMVVNENGKLYNLPLNLAATEIALTEEMISVLDYIVGNALIINADSIL